MSPPDTQLAARRTLLEANLKTGSSWLWSIAGFSLVNTILLRVGSEYSFCVGLVFTQLNDYAATKYAQEAGAAASPWLTVGSYVFDALLIGGAAFVARSCERRTGWIVMAGLVLYALDTALVALAGLSISLVVHGLSLWYVFRAFRAIGELKRLPAPEIAAAPSSPAPPPFPDAPPPLPARVPAPAQLVSAGVPAARPTRAGLESAESYAPPTLPSSLREPAKRSVIQPKIEAKVEESGEPAPESILTRGFTGWPALIVALLVLGVVVAGVVYVCQESDASIARSR